MSCEAEREIASGEVLDGEKDQDRLSCCSSCEHENHSPVVDDEDEEIDEEADSCSSSSSFSSSQTESDVEWISQNCDEFGSLFYLKSLQTDLSPHGFNSDSFSKSNDSASYENESSFNMHK